MMELLVKPANSDGLTGFERGLLGVVRVEEEAMGA